MVVRARALPHPIRRYGRERSRYLPRARARRVHAKPVVFQADDQPVRAGRGRRARRRRVYGRTSETQGRKLAGELFPGRLRESEVALIASCPCARRLSAVGVRSSLPSNVRAALTKAGAGARPLELTAPPDEAVSERRIGPAAWLVPSMASCRRSLRRDRRARSAPRRSVWLSAVPSSGSVANIARSARSALIRSSS